MGGYTPLSPGENAIHRGPKPINVTGLIVVPFPGEGGHQRKTFPGCTSWRACQSGSRPSCKEDEMRGSGLREILPKTQPHSQATRLVNKVTKLCGSIENRALSICGSVYTAFTVPKLQTLTTSCKDTSTELYFLLTLYDLARIFCRTVLLWKPLRPPADRDRRRGRSGPAGTCTRRWETSSSGTPVEAGGFPPPSYS